jgi:DNA-binding NarL/FixJ family response regulator
MGLLGKCDVEILLVEDFKPYRKFIASVLAENLDLRIICEVSNGLDAVAKARELRPDVILMDMGLPELNGLEAARRIHEFTPSSRILFLTQEADTTVAREALRSGACGYILKKEAATELLPGLEAVLGGKRFVSKGLLNGFGSLKEADQTDHKRASINPCRNSL